MEVVIAASIAAVPATIGAVAALKAARGVKTNGSKKTVGQLVELLYEDVQHLKEHVKDDAVHRGLSDQALQDHRDATE